MAFSHRYAASSGLKQTINIRGEIATILVVKSSVPIDCNDEGFDQEAFSELSDAVVEYMRINNSIDSAEITSA
jgi:hypothetical protein